MLKSITLSSSSSSSSSSTSPPSLPLLFKLTKPPSSSSSSPSSSSFTRCLSLPFSPTNPTSPRVFNLKNPMNNLLCKLGLGPRTQEPSMDSSTIPQVPDDDIPGPGLEFAEFGAGCFWGVELAFQRVPGVKLTEVGYTQGLNDNPSYEDICTGMTNHSEVVRVQFDPKECSFDNLLDVFWARHDPTTLNRQGNDVGTQYRSGIYFYTPEQEQAAIESRDRQQKLLNRKIVTEILPAKKFYRAEEYHQQYLAKGGRFGFQQSAEKGCNDPIRCYG